MKMKSTFKVFAASTLALLLAFGGCRDAKKSRRMGGGGLVMLAAGALFPAVSSAMLSAKTTAMAANGRKLYQAIMIANINRENAGKGTTVWPRTEFEAGMESEDGGEQDIGDRVFSSATDYFNALFDIKHYGMTDWRPEVEDLDIGVLGNQAFYGGRTIRADGLDWYIAANVRDGMPDDIPVLISANFNPALLLNKWDGHTDGTRPLPIGPESGAAKSLFNDKAIVVVRKGGAVDVIKKKYLAYDVLYKKTSFDLTDMNPPLKYLTPTGVVTPAGHR